MLLMRASAFVLLASLCVGRNAYGQDRRGIVSDSASRLPIAGAVVVLLDSAGGTITRSISNSRGEFFLTASPESRRLRVVRMGFRPREIRLSSTSSAPIEVRMAVIPTLLELVRVVENGMCPRRSDRQAAFALLEQARAGLLNAVVAREAHPAAMTILPYERHMIGITDKIDRQEVHMKSSDRVTMPFYAVRGAKEFVREGFMRDSSDTRVYYGPDADVLLDEGFASGYCFHLEKAKVQRRNQVGLAFVPASRRRGRTDIEGTLWVDTVSRKLIEMEYRYLGLPFATDPVQPGGTATFWELPNGIVFIDKWHFRLPVPQYDTTYSPNNNNVPQVHLWYAAREAGGEVASAIWPDTQSYQGPLGILNARAVDQSGKPVTGVVVRLKETDYVASPDSQGFFAISDLLPGPYEAIVIDPTLADYEMTLPSSLKFVAVRDSIVQQTMVVPSPLEVVRRPCTRNPSDYLDDPLLLWRVITPDKRAVKGAQWRLMKVAGKPWAGVIESGITDGDGRVRQCMLLRPDDVVEMQVWRDVPSQAYRKSLGRNGATFTVTLLPPALSPP